MKKVLLTILVLIVVVGALAAVGVVSYRAGYINGASGSGNVPAWGQFQRMNPNQMPMHRFDNNFGPWDQPNHFRMMRGSFGFGFFPVFHFVWNVAVLGLIVWFFYWLFTKSGWRITRDAGAGQVQNSKTDEGN